MTRPSHRARRKRSQRIAVPRTFAPGVPIHIVPGRALRVAVLGTTEDELFGIELGSGAYVRVQREGIESLAGEDDPFQERPHGGSVANVVSCVPRVDDPLDPARPEALWLAESPVRVAPLKPRQLRRLAGAVVARERQGGMILNSRGPSIAYGELDPQGESVMLIEVGAKGLLLQLDPSGSVTLKVRWGGVVQRFPIVDVHAIQVAYAHAHEALRGETLARALGFKPRFVLVAFDRVRDGYVRKMVVALLAR